MYTKYVNKKIQETLNAKERVLSRKKNTPFPDNKSADSYRTINDIASRTVFLRMISNKKTIEGKVKPIVIMGGERESPDKMKHGTQDLYTDKGSGPKPLAGITDVEISYKGGMKAMRETTINWTISSLEDLERLTPHFLSIGKTVMVDWGWVHGNKSIEQQFGSNFFTNGKIDNSLFTDIQSKILKIGGNYGAVGGVISNFSYDLNDDGGFKCTTKLTSMGTNLFKKPVDKGNSQKAFTSSQDQSAVGEAPMDSLIKTILNLKEYLIDTYFVNLTNTKLATSDKYGEVMGGSRKLDQYLVGIAREKKDENSDIYKFIWNEDGSSKSGKIGLEGVGVDGGIVVNKNEDVIWYCPLNDFLDQGLAETMFVTWGWLEDNLFSRYTGYVGSDDELKLSIRSIDTVLDDNGEPSLNQQNEDNTRLKVKKKAIKIGNHPFLHSKNPLAFLLPGQYPDISKFGVDKVTADDYWTVLESDVYRLGKNYLKGIFKTFLAYTPGTIFGHNKRLTPLGRNFEVEGSEKTEGYLRNILVNISQVQKAFGINVGSGLKVDARGGSSGWSSRSVYVGDISPPSTIEAGINNLLNQLNNNFFGIWDLQLTTDPYDTTNIRIVDNKLGLQKKDAQTYTKFNANGKIISEGIYKFPSFKTSSTVKSQNLSFKIPSGQALTAMYGSNKNLKAISEDPHHDNSDLAAVFATDNSVQDKDNFLDGIEPAYRKEGWGIKKGSFGVWVASQNPIGVNRPDLIDGGRGNDDFPFENEKILAIGDGLKINPNAKWRPLELGETATNAKVPTDAAKSEEVGILYKYNEGAGGIIDLNQVDLVSSTPGASGTTAPTNTPIFDPTEGDIFSETVQYYLENDKRRKNPYLPMPPYYFNEKFIGGGFKLANDVVPVIRNVIYNNLDALNKRENIYKSDFIIPAELTLEIDGIEGLLPGDIIQTDYIQKKYNKSVSSNSGELGPFTYFQIFGLTHKITAAGWTTEITTKMRTNAAVLNANAKDVMKTLNPTIDTEEQANNQEVLTQAAADNVESIINENTDESLDLSQFSEEDLQIVAMFNPSEAVRAEAQMLLDESSDKPVLNPLNAKDVDDNEFANIAIQNQGMQMWHTPAAGTTSNLTERSSEGFTADQIYSTTNFARTLTNSTVPVDTDSTVENKTFDEMGISYLPPSLTGHDNEGNIVISEGQGPNGEAIKANSDGLLYLERDAELGADFISDFLNIKGLKADDIGNVSIINSDYDEDKKNVLKADQLESASDIEMAESMIGSVGEVDREKIGAKTLDEVAGALNSPSDVVKANEASAKNEIHDISATKQAEKEEEEKREEEYRRMLAEREVAREIENQYNKLVNIGEIITSGASNNMSSATRKANSISARQTAAQVKAGIQNMNVTFGMGYLQWHLIDTVVYEYNDDDPEPKYLVEKKWVLLDERADLWYIKYPFLLE